MTEQQPNLDGWDDFMGRWLKADMVKSWPALFIPTEIEKSSFDEEGNASIVYKGEYEGKVKVWQPNKTNLDIMKSMVSNPKGLIGKKVFFKQVMNFNPQLKKKVPGLEIDTIE